MRRLRGKGEAKKKVCVLGPNYHEGGWTITQRGRVRRNCAILSRRKEGVIKTASVRDQQAKISTKHKGWRRETEGAIEDEGDVEIYHYSSGACPMVGVTIYMRSV
jgi:hypothetical protein